MALQRRLLARAFRRAPALSLAAGRRSATEGAPYRPSPAEEYHYPKSAQHWLKKFPATSEQEDEYPKEEVYLDEVEDRMRKYDAQYSMSDRLKKQYNEFGWDDWDDRASVNYGNALDDGQFGRGKKIDPSHYVSPDYVRVNRNPIPPVQYLTPEQIRRARGRFAHLREVVPEEASVWKTWNIYTTVGAAVAIFASKEILIIGGHEMWDVLLLYGAFGCFMAVGADWLSWWSALVQQERYDKEWMQMETRVQALHERLETLAKRPNLKTTVAQLGFFREHLSERVLQKTLSNQLSRTVDVTIKKLKDKVAAEAATKAAAASTVKGQALDATLQYFEGDQVQQQFTKEAMAAFLQKDFAAMPQGTTEKLFESDLFAKQYEANRAKREKEFVAAQEKAGTLDWVFKSDKDRAAKAMAKADKEKEYAKRVKAWEATHNPVGDVPMPAFS